MPKALGYSSAVMGWKPQRNWTSDVFQAYLKTKQREIISHKLNLCAPMFITAQFTIAKCQKQPGCPLVNEWINKLLYIYTMEYYTAERKELPPFATVWIELESIMLS